MTQITLDANTASKLDALTEPVQVCDPAGRVVGRFIPKAAEEFDPRELYPCVDKTMADADAGDPALESYQQHRQGNRS
jgi:hypothetical protein